MSNDPKILATSADAEIEKQQFSRDWIGKVAYWIFHHRRWLLVVNILINASQAIETKMGSIVVSTQHMEKDKENLLKISDNGKGIDAKTLKQIFDPFFTTKRNQGGTGLGLSIAYGIIKEHKGRIEVESKQGSGTTFSLYIPVSQKENQ